QKSGPADGYLAAKISIECGSYSYGITGGIYYRKVCGFRGFVLERNIAVIKAVAGVCPVPAETFHPGAVIGIAEQFLLRDIHKVGIAHKVGAIGKSTSHGLSNQMYIFSRVKTVGFQIIGTKHF